MPQDFPLPIDGDAIAAQVTGALARLDYLNLDDQVIGKAIEVTCDADPKNSVTTIGEFQLGEDFKQNYQPEPNMTIIPEELEDVVQITMNRQTDNGDGTHTVDGHVPGPGDDRSARHRLIRSRNAKGARPRAGRLLRALRRRSFSSCRVNEGTSPAKCRPLGSDNYRPTAPSPSSAAAERTTSMTICTAGLRCAAPRSMIDTALVSCVVTARRPCRGDTGSSRPCRDQASSRSASAWPRAARSQPRTVVAGRPSRAAIER